ncbi:mating-type switching protein swi10 [Podospora australis]|uniref:Mating-type switching protein swi10 n=1 Tax=Podospora australis TaxID=1536484 RepID=A0AAN6WWC7_9PEZI|nr:mating-type switching protein swi10 [Podospora australis]
MNCFLSLASASTDIRPQANRQPSQHQSPQKPPFLPPKPQQPIPQRLDRAPPPRSANASSSSGPSAGAGGGGGGVQQPQPQKIVQPTPQALPARSSGSSILVSPRQKGNPVLACLKSVAWEYSDIPADYGLGQTTCALFLSLKYHRLHPEYIYTRIRNLQGKYLLRILLTMVDIPNHEDSLRELSKTSLINNVTVILCWSAAEAARYLELYKSYEHAGFGAIKGQQARGYAEKLVEFVTVPRNINKSDAVALVSTFGSLRHAVNGDKEQVATVGGWGERKVKSWCRAVEAPFRVKKAAKRTVGGTQQQRSAQAAASASIAKEKEIGEEIEDDDEDMGELLMEMERAEQSAPPQPVPAHKEDEQLDGGIAAALAKLRNNG